MNWKYLITGKSFGPGCHDTSSTAIIVLMEELKGNVF